MSERESPERPMCQEHFSPRRDNQEPAVCEKAFAKGGMYPCDFAPSASSERTETTDVLGYAVWIEGAERPIHVAHDRVHAEEYAKYLIPPSRLVPLVSAATLAQQAERIAKLREFVADVRPFARERFMVGAEPGRFYGTVLAMCDILDPGGPR